MRRREFITLVGGASVAWPLAARAQPSMPVLGYVHPGSLDGRTPASRCLSARTRMRPATRQEQNVAIEYRWAGRSDQYAALAQELVSLRPEVIFTQGTQVAATLQRETHAIPIVFNNVSDPIGSGFVANLAHPGGNLTGILLYETGITGKWLALLKEIAPRLTRVALVGNPKTVPFDYFQRAAAAAAPSLGIELVPTPIENADADIERAIESFTAAPNGGLLDLPYPTFRIRRTLSSHSPIGIVCLPSIRSAYLSQPVV